MLVACPLHNPLRARCHILRTQAVISISIPLGCKSLMQSSKGAAGTGTLASTHWAACARQSPGPYFSLPSVGTAAAAGCALPPYGLGGGSCHVRGCQAVVLGGVPLLCRLWDAVQPWPAGALGCCRASAHCRSSPPERVLFGNARLPQGLAA